MRCIPVLPAALLTMLLTACGRPHDPQRAENLADTLADALVADPAQLKALRAQCAADRQAMGEDACSAAAEAARRRFFSGQAGPDEFQTLAELPPISPSFDEPGDRP